MEFFIVFVNNPRKLQIQKSENMTKVAKYLSLGVSSSTLSGLPAVGRDKHKKNEICSQFDA